MFFSFFFKQFFWVQVRIQLTSSLDTRYRNVKLCGTHTMMLLRGFPRRHFLTLFLKESGNDFWIISIIPV
uniref:Secreted protein n=1 Tax=Rhizophora mucronata TaxID=61149 RepID=A0A2P2R3H6_RHIMU